MVRTVKSEAGAKSPKGGQQQQQQQQQRSGGGAGRARRQHTTAAKFAGATEALAAVVYDVGKDSQSKWTGNQHELEEYALRTPVFENPLVVAKCVKELVAYKEKIPPMPDFDGVKQYEEDGVTVKTDADGKELALTPTQLQVAIRLYEKEVDAARKEIRSVRKDMTTLYGQVLGQCTPAMRRLLESHANWQTIDLSKDPIELLKAIQSITYGQQTHQCLPLTLHQAMRSLFNISQGRATVEDHYKKFVAVLESNEAVGMLPQLLWTKNFIEAQGHDMGPPVLCQDNQSAIKLESNGIASAGKRSRHMNIRYFFIAEKVANKEVLVSCCPTDDMIADFFTKPLQGSKFLRFRDTILNVQGSQYNMT